MIKTKILPILLLIGVCFQLNASEPNAPFNLRCFDKTNPVGVAEAPYFAWFIDDPDDNEIQSAYQIIVSSSKAKLDANKGDVWDSNKVESRLQNYVYFQGKNLLSATQYFWKVRTWDKDGNVGPYSDAAVFSTGLLSNEDWAGAKWIKRNTEDQDDWTYFRKQAKLPNKTIKRAVVYITACHSYDLFINEKFVGKGFNYHYPQFSYYHAWDVTEFLSGNQENLFACLTHWYSGGQGRAKGTRGLLMKTVIEYTDATSTIVGTDGSWKQTQATQWLADQPQRNGEGIGRIEKIDSRNIIENWQAWTFDDTNWASATEIGPQPTEPWNGTLQSDLTRVIEKEIKPVSVNKIDKGKYVVDLGKIFPGQFRIKFEGGAAGDTVNMFGGFVLNSDGTVSKKINQRANMDFAFILNGKKAEFAPQVYLGMQYLQVENSPSTLTTENVSFIVRHYELTPALSHFESSDAMLNKVWNLMVHSLIAGTQEGFVDTPTREKGAFLGDSWSQAVPCLSVMYDRAMNLRTLSEFFDSQDQYWPDGRVNAVYPNGDGGRDIPDYTQQFLIWIWDYYMQTGNTSFLKSNYQRIKKVADYVDTYINEETGLVHNLKGGRGPYEFGIIDWPMDMRYGYDMGVESRTVIDAYAYADFKIMAQIADVLGNSADKDIYTAKASAMKKAMNAYLLKDGVYIDGIYGDKTTSSHVSQHANMIPYALNIAPKDNHEQIIDAIKDRKMSVGMITVRWLPEALGMAEEGEHLIDLYTNTEWDGWAKNITQGATVTWECWNAIDINESMSHPWGAVGLLGIQNYILGIKSLAPQNDKVQIRPLYFGNKLTHASGKYTTDKGDISVHWKKEKNSYKLTVEIPDNVEARVYVPVFDSSSNTIIFDQKEMQGVRDGDYLYLDNIGSGKHTFER